MLGERQSTGVSRPVIYTRGSPRLDTFLSEDLSKPGHYAAATEKIHEGTVFDGSRDVISQGGLRGRGPRGLDEASAKPRRGLPEEILIFQGHLRAPRKGLGAAIVAGEIATFTKAASAAAAIDPSLLPCPTCSLSPSSPERHFIWINGE